MDYTHHQTIALIGPVMPRPMNPTPFPQIAVDGGVHFAHQPILWVGDGDSSHLVGETGISLIKKNSQDETDLRFCLDLIQGWKWSELLLFGFLGGRRDHELANFGEMHRLFLDRPESVRACFYDDEFNERIDLYQSGQHSIEIQGLFSILTFEHSILSLSGDCDYSLHQQELGLFSGRGVSNNGHGSVNIQCKTPFLLVRGGKG